MTAEPPAFPAGPTALAGLVERLPHRPPFLFITRLLHSAHGSARAEWVVRGDEEALQGHFPGNPIVPGVLIGEALAQAAGLALASTLPATANSAGSLARLELRFHAPVSPPAIIALSAERTGGMGALHQFDVVASRGGERIAHGTLVLAVPGSAPAVDGQTATPR